MLLAWRISWIELYPPVGTLLYFSIASKMFHPQWLLCSKMGRYGKDHDTIEVGKNEKSVSVSLYAIAT
jgi:hypothetical protein